jgi:hypothetical protein
VAEDQQYPRRRALQAAPGRAGSISLAGCLVAKKKSMSPGVAALRKTLRLRIWGYVH